jgi:FkbM family methyltransferase
MTERKSAIFNWTGSRSQYGQETFVQHLVYRDRTGFYVDVGARCGRAISNTLGLEQAGWSGICVEPHPDLFAQLRDNRPRARLVNRAASSVDGPDLEFVRLLEEPFGNSGLLATFRNPDRLARMKHEIIAVPTSSLSTILAEQAAPEFIHYLDVDVEGHELEVLQGIDFNRYRFGVIGVETAPGTARYDQIAAILEEAGYAAIAVLGSDTMFMPAPGAR